jgi:hypothetical protein
MVIRAAATGLGLGLAWGIAARVWMRLISTDPEFSWTGTAMILAVTGVSGLTLGILSGVRRAGRSRWWRVLAVLCLPTFGGPGVVFLPAFLLGGLLYLEHLWSRIAGAVGLVLAQLALGATTLGEPINPWYFHGGFLVLSLTLAAGAAELYRPSGEPAVAEQELPVDPLPAGRAEEIDQVGGVLRRAKAS